MKLYSQKVDSEKPVTTDEKIETPPVVKEKKPRTEKQIAALAKAQEARKRKREAEISVQKDEGKNEEPKVEPKIEPKVEVEPKVEPEIEQKVEKIEENVIDDDEPPKWFVKYVKEKNKRRHEKEGKKLSVRAEKRESEEIAERKWADPKSRDKIVKTVDNHEDRLYRAIFGRR